MIAYGIGYTHVELLKKFYCSTFPIKQIQLLLFKLHISFLKTSIYITSMHKIKSVKKCTVELKQRRLKIINAKLRLDCIQPYKSYLFKSLSHAVGDFFPFLHSFPFFLFVFSYIFSLCPNLSLKMCPRG